MEVMDTGELEQLAHELGGGWRVERGVMPVVVLTIEEAQALLRERATIYLLYAVRGRARSFYDVYGTREAADAAAERLPGETAVVTRTLDVRP